VLLKVWPRRRSVPVEAAVRTLHSPVDGLPSRHFHRCVFTVFSSSIKHVEFFMKLVADYISVWTSNRVCGGWDVLGIIP
jgi:hypothetical protein